MWTLCETLKRKGLFRNETYFTECSFLKQPYFNVKMIGFQCKTIKLFSKTIGYYVKLSQYLEKVSHYKVIAYPVFFSSMAISSNIKIRLLGVF